MKYGGLNSSQILRCLKQVPDEPSTQVATIPERASSP